MTEHINAALAVMSAIGGMLTGVAAAVWYLSDRNTTLKQLARDIDELRTERGKIKADIESAVCAAFKLSIGALRLEQAERHGGHDKDIAALDTRVCAAEKDIEAIFGRLERRHHDQGHPDGDRRGWRKT
ncbi:hypothetical protein [Desulfobulbus sp.]|uniref:hypothetical protein n=1 Tax=Desulfobulbus sp. TaxID=895 RepID=UPI00286EF82D|nr:hypothetical protein [Desulfobulbus sp.]